MTKKLYLFLLNLKTKQIEQRKDQEKFNLLFPIYKKGREFETNKERKEKNREIAGGNY